jgi:hypothetical protein
MRTTIARLIGLAALVALLLGGAGLGQQAGDANDGKKPAEEKKPSQLEELIAQALRDNPDVRVADAKLREADAELNRVRLQVIQKVVAHQHTVDTLMSAVKMTEAGFAAAEARVKLVEADYKRMTVSGAAVAQADIEKARADLDQAKANLETVKAALQAAKADLAKAQAELPYLLGKSAKGGDGKTRVSSIADLLAVKGQQAVLDELYDLVDRKVAQDALGGARAQPQGSVADRLRKALDGSVSLKFEQAPLSDVLVYMQHVAEVPVVTNLLPPNFLERPLTLNLEKIPLGAAFEALEDISGMHFGVRDYGILVSNQRLAGMTHLHDFWKTEQQNKAAKEKPRQ